MYIYYLAIFGDLGFVANTLISENTFIKHYINVVLRSRFAEQKYQTQSSWVCTILDAPPPRLQPGLRQLTAKTTI